MSFINFSTVLPASIVQGSVFLYIQLIDFLSQTLWLQALRESDQVSVSCKLMEVDHLGPMRWECLKHWPMSVEYYLGYRLPMGQGGQGLQGHHGVWPRDLLHGLGDELGGGSLLHVDRRVRQTRLTLTFMYPFIKIRISFTNHQNNIWQSNISFDVPVLFLSNFTR